MEGVLQLLILAILGLLGGVLAGVVGVGGAAIFIPALVYVAGWGIKEAVAASLVITVFSLLSGTDQERRGYLRLAAQGRITDAELDEALAELEETRRTAERELAAIRSRREEIEVLERDRDALMASWSAAVPTKLEQLTPEKRNELYHTLRLEVRPHEEGYEVTGLFCTSEPLSFSRSLITAPTPPPPRSFSAGSSPR